MELKEYSVLEIRNNYDKLCKKGYLKVKGFYRDDKKKGVILPDQDAEYGLQFFEPINRLLKMIDAEKYEGWMRLICIVDPVYDPSYNIGRVVKIELLDDKDNITNSATIGESEIPKELEGKI